MAESRTAQGCAVIRDHPQQLLTEVGASVDYDRRMKSFAIALLLAACVPHNEAGKDEGRRSAVAVEKAPAAAVPPPKADAPPAADVRERGVSSPMREPREDCRIAADCEVKNVGNCCGYYPACVNKDAKTDPDGVQAACNKQGMASICGFPEIKSCECVENRCAPSATTGLQ